MRRLREATTIKARAQRLLKDARDLLSDKALPKEVHDALDSVAGALTKTWADLEADAGAGDTPPAGEATQESGRMQESDLSHDDIRQLLRGALAGGKDMSMMGMPGYWVRDVYDDYFVYSDDASGKTYKRSYVIDDKGTVTLGEPQEVLATTVYLPVGEALQLSMVAGLSEAKVTKSEGDAGNFPASDYAYVPDPEKPSTWKLRMTSTPGGEPDAVHTGAACAALGPNPPHGKGADIPAGDMAKVKGKVLAAWKKAHPDAKPDDVPAWMMESQMTEISVDFIPLLEKAVRRDGTVPIKIIQPGWGSSGFYGADVLKRDGPKVFTKGLKLYWDHPTPTEEAERPERSLHDLAGEFIGDAAYQEQGPAGPGLYSDAKVFKPYQESVNELAPHIGVSIRAMGQAKAGEAEGKKGAIIEKIVAAKSVDFVTTPGAGGQVLQLFESARQRQPTAVEGGNEVTEEEARQLRESVAQLTAENKRLGEAMILSQAERFAANRLAGIDLPAMTRARLLESLRGSPPLKDGKLDEAAYAQAIDAAAKSELAYLAEVSGSGRIRGMGGTTGSAQEPKPEDLEKSLQESFGRMGLDSKKAAIAAKGR